MAFCAREAGADLRRPYLGKHVRSLTFRHSSEQHVPIPITADAKEDLRVDIWDMAVGLIHLCPDIVSLDWETGVGINGALWKVSTIVLLTPVTRINLMKDHFWVKLIETADTCWSIPSSVSDMARGLSSDRSGATIALRARSRPQEWRL